MKQLHISAFLKTLTLKPSSSSTSVRSGSSSITDHLYIAINSILNTAESAFNPWMSEPFNPLSPHDALKHHFTSLKTDLIFLQPRVLEQKFPETGLPIHGNFL